jgi:hypothetical protein
LLLENQIVCLETCFSRIFSKNQIKELLKFLILYHLKAVTAVIAAMAAMAAMAVIAVIAVIALIAVIAVIVIIAVVAVIIRALSSFYQSHLSLLN